MFERRPERESTPGEGAHAFTFAVTNGACVGVCDTCGEPAQRGHFSLVAGVVPVAPFAFWCPHPLTADQGAARRRAWLYGVRRG